MAFVRRFHRRLTRAAADAIVPAAMLQLFSAAAVILMLAAPSASPWIGRWELDPQQSQPKAAGERYKRVLLRIDPWQDGLRVSYDMVRHRGGVLHMEWSGRLDGKDYVVQGVDSAMTNAYSPGTPNGYSIVVKVEGRAVARAEVTVSVDGQTLTSVTAEKSASGESRTTSVYRRQSP